MGTSKTKAQATNTPSNGLRRLRTRTLTLGRQQLQALWSSEILLIPRVLTWMFHCFSTEHKVCGVELGQC